jgi:hypothetical protein
MPPLISTYKYLLSQYSSSTQPFCISSLVLSSGDLDEKAPELNEKLPCSEALNPELSSFWFSPHLGRNGCQFHRS